MEALFLWMVVCMDGAQCASSQVYRLDTFNGVAAGDDCKARLNQVAQNAATAALPGVTLVCKTQRQFDVSGVN